MKNKLAMIAGGLAATLVPLGILGAYALATSTEPAPPASADVAEVAPEPVPSPLDAPALTATTSHAEPAPSVATPEPEPEVDPYAPELRSSGDIRVRRLIVTTGIARHEPSDARDMVRLGAHERIYAFVDAVNESGDPVELEVTFEPPRGETAGHVELEVPAHVRRWRTWAYTRHVYEDGRWQAVVRGPDGRVLARRAFDVVR